MPHLRLLKQLALTTLPPNLINWLSSYLRGRTACCQVPQGSVLSPCLLNFFVADHPLTADLVSSYAYDFTASTSSINVADATDRLARHVTSVKEWACIKRLSISLPKSHTTLFTSDTPQSFIHPDVKLAGARIPLCHQSQILRVMLDTRYSFCPYARITAKHTQSFVGCKLGTVEGGPTPQLQDPH